MIWTNKLSHIHVKCNYWCSVWWISFNSWESNISTVSTLLQYIFPIGQLILIISQCTYKITFRIFTTWMTSFIVWKRSQHMIFKLEFIHLSPFHVNYMLYLSWFLIVSVAIHLTIPENDLKCYKWGNHTSFCDDL